MLRSTIAGIALLCAIAMAALIAMPSAEAAPRIAAGVSSAPVGALTDFSARRRHHVRHHRARHHRRHVAAVEPCDAVCQFFGGQAPETRWPSDNHGRALHVSSGPIVGGGSIVAYARSQIGNGAIYGRANLWCARFMNVVLKRTGHRGTGSDMASSFAHYGRRVSGPQVGAIAVMRRGRRGGHVGVVSGITPAGDPIIISGNHGHRVAEGVYPRSRIYAYVMPSG